MAIRKSIPKVLTLLMALVVSFALFGCSSEETEAENGEAVGGASVQTNDKQPIEILESGYYVTDDNLVYYGVKWENPNDDYSIDYPTLKITAKDADGKIVFANEQVMSFMLPGEVQEFGCLADQGEKIKSIEFNATADESNYYSADTKAVEYFTISNTNEVEDAYGFTKYTGEIAANYDLSDYSQAWVSVILRDKDGNIVYGQNSFADMPAQDESVPFEIDCGSDVPEHASYEIYALVWY